MSAEDRHLVTLFPRKPVEFVRAEGSHLFSADGSRYVDLGGASHGVANFGHAHPRIVRAIEQQSRRLVHVVQTMPNRVRGEFLDRLHDVLPGHLNRSFLANSGTEAVEAALKFAHATTGRSRFVALRNAFHGRTLGALSATFRPNYRRPFEKLLPQTDFVPINDEHALGRAVTSDTAAILVEPIQGEGGVTVANDDYLRAVERVAHERGALLIVDEIQTGLGRTGWDLAIDGLGLRPDMVLLGKSLAGELPMGVCSMTEEVARSMPAGGHGNTFGGSPIVCAAATAALEVLRDERLSERARLEGERFRSEVEALRLPLVREVRGRGLMIGLDLRIKPQPALDLLLQERYLALPAGNTVLRLLPPLNIPRQDLEGARGTLARVLADPSLVPPAVEAVV